MTSENWSRPCPRSNKFRSDNLPRLRSRPIQTRSASFQSLGRCSRKNRSWPVLRYLSLRLSIPACAVSTNFPSVASVSCPASHKSVSNAKCRCLSWFARNRTSSASNSSSIALMLVKSVGTTTRVAICSGNPRE